MKNDFRHIRSHAFRNRRYKIKWRKPRDSDLKSKFVKLGDCESPQCRNPTMRVNPNMGEDDLLRILIDESLHACFFDLDNESVGDAAGDISKFLTRVGFRLK